MEEYKDGLEYETCDYGSMSSWNGEILNKFVVNIYPFRFGLCSSHEREVRVGCFIVVKHRINDAVPESFSLTLLVPDFRLWQKSQEHHRELVLSG